MKSKAALAVLVTIVAQLKVQIQLCANILIGAINASVGSLLGVVVQLLATLKVDILACIDIFIGSCSKYVTTCTCV